MTAAITTYGTLKTALARAMNRTDLTTDLPGCVQRAEEHFNRELRHQKNLYRAENFAFTGEYTARPTDLAELVHVELYINGKRNTIYAESAHAGVGLRGTDAGDPQAISLVNDMIRLSPPPSGSMTGDLFYYRGVTTITSGDAAFNWLLTAHSGAYLYRALMELSILHRDQKRLAEYGAAFQGVWASVVRAGKQQRQSSGMRVRLGR
jgi:hypothetical protein